MGAATLIPEVVSHWGKRATVLILLLSTSQFLLNIVGDEFLSLNLRYFSGALNLTFKEQLLFEELGQRGVKRV